MRNTLVYGLSAATIVAAFGLSGCSHHDEPKPKPDLGTSSTAFDARPSSTNNPLPAAEALTDVLYRLADPTVKGADKLGLVEDTAAQDAATIDRFASALRDGGFNPLTCTATDIAWSDRQAGNALATINITTSNPGHPGGFTFPMEFHPHEGGWQLSRQTADMLLAFGNARSEAGPGSDSPATGPAPAPPAPTDAPAPGGAVPPPAEPMPPAPAPPR